MSLVVASRADARKIAVLFGVLLLFCLSICALGFKSYFRQQFINERGVSVEGETASVVYHHGYKGGGGYIVYYDFECNGAIYRGSSPAKAAWAQFAYPRMPIRVKFIRGNPNENWPPDVGASTSLFAVLLPFLICTSLFAFLIAKTLRAPVAQTSPALSQ
jgi:hypothetical protein